MGSLSLYRGNLHRVSNAPREWLMPPHKISHKDFNSLLHRRQESLHRLRSATSNPNPNANPNPSDQQQQQPKHEFVGDSGCSKQKDPQITAAKPPQPQPLPAASGDVAGVTKVTVGRVEKDHLQPQHRVVRCAKDQSGSDGDTRVEKRKRSRDALSSPETKSIATEVTRVVSDCDHAVLGAPQDLIQVTQLASVPGPVDTPVEITKNLELLSVKEKKKRDLQHNLEVLNARKHNLVQMLKQVLNTEEEMKRRISLKASGFATPVPQQVEATTDLGSNPGQVNRVCQQVDFCGDIEEESEDIPNNNALARQLHRKRSTSPSASSPLRKVAHSPRQHIVVPLANRQSSGVSGNTQTSSSMVAVASSPSRFTPSGHLQGHPGNLHPLSVSGTHCTTSSPSPAGSGGTSVFRDARITSPSWS